MGGGSVSWDDINDEIAAVPTFLVCCIQRGTRRGINITSTVYIWIHESFSYACSVLIGQIHLFQIDKPHLGKITVKSYVSPHRGDLGITSSLFTAGVSLGKYAGTNNKLRWCDYSFAHLLPVHSEKGTLPPPYNTSCRSVSTWRKAFQTEDASVSSEPPIINCPFAVAVLLHGRIWGCRWQVGEQVWYVIARS